jgi:hypothetical protein
MSPKIRFHRLKDGNYGSVGGTVAVPVAVLMPKALEGALQPKAPAENNVLRSIVRSQEHL